MSPSNWDPGYYAAKDAAEDAEIRHLHEIGNRAHQRGVARTLDHYSEVAAAAREPGLVELLRECRAALGPEYVDLLRRIDDALGQRP